MTKNTRPHEEHPHGCHWTRPRKTLSSPSKRWRHLAFPATTRVSRSRAISILGSREGCDPLAANWWPKPLTLWCLPVVPQTPILIMATLIAVPFSAPGVTGTRKPRIKGVTSPFFLRHPSFQQRNKHIFASSRINRLQTPWLTQNAHARFPASPRVYGLSPASSRFSRQMMKGKVALVAALAICQYWGSSHASERRSECERSGDAHLSQGSEASHRRCVAVKYISTSMPRQIYHEENQHKINK